MSYEYSAFPGRVRVSRPGSDRLRPDMRLADVIPHWRAARRPALKTVDSVSRAAAEFAALVGDMPITRIRHEAMFDFRDAVAKLPAHRGKLDRQYGVRALVRRFEDGLDDRPRLAPTTVGKKVNAIQALMGFAFAERWIAEDDVHNIPLRKKPMLARRPFTRDELARLFALPLFVRPWNGPERPHQVSDETVRWLLLLGMMTGARIEELSQLDAEDIASVEGCWRIAITDSNADGPTAEKHLKSAASRREIPMHRRLVDLGLLRLCERRRAAGVRRLFPDLERDRYARLSSVASRRCGNQIDKVSRDPRLCFHALRHSFKTHCRNMRLEDSTNDQLTGHAPPTVGRRYGEGLGLPALAAEIARLDFEFIDWEPVLRAA